MITDITGEASVANLSVEHRTCEENPKIIVYLTVRDK